MSSQVSSVSICSLIYLTPKSVSITELGQVIMRMPFLYEIYYNSKLILITVKIETEFLTAVDKDKVENEGSLV